ncbi:hypothetical protein RFI_30344 [Reticulomyxa filosa]|uniref:Uncharacterized protein n=1 Tax=Reticulomyxa filosa TaxID=46433 RepID=X6M0W1_RETFI|nr:hypothetical protein RFI_30344 [Reticulomyxa filosa]|eukprot:ETO07047.1 hypothetical protein RFI_30344 [Reticulomyxa filosa]
MPRKLLYFVLGVFIGLLFGIMVILELTGWSALYWIAWSGFMTLARFAESTGNGTCTSVMGIHQTVSCEQKALEIISKFWLKDDVIKRISEPVNNKLALLERWRGCYEVRFRFPTRPLIHVQLTKVIKMIEEEKREVNIMYIYKQNKHRLLQMNDNDSNVDETLRKNMDKKNFENGVIVQAHEGEYIGFSYFIGYLYLQFLVDWLEIPAIAVNYRLAPEFP